MRPLPPNTALEPTAAAPSLEVCSKFSLQFFRAVVQLWIVRPLERSYHEFTFQRRVRDSEEDSLALLRHAHGARFAEDIIRHKGRIREGHIWNADDIMRGHHCRIARLAGVYANLRGYGSREKPKGTQPLGRDEFRCFGCESCYQTRGGQLFYYAGGRGVDVV